MRTQTQKTQDSAKAEPVKSSCDSTPQNSHPVLQLQQKYGNQTVQRLLKSMHIQTKFTIGAPNDNYEQEADRVVDQVIGAPQEVSSGCMPEAIVKRQTEVNGKHYKPILSMAKFPQLRQTSNPALTASKASASRLIPSVAPSNRASVMISAMFECIRTVQQQTLLNLSMPLLLR